MCLPTRAEQLLDIAIRFLATHPAYGQFSASGLVADALSMLFPALRDEPTSESSCAFVRRGPFPANARFVQSAKQCRVNSAAHWSVPLGEVAPGGQLLLAYTWA
jgi:hypothetical protein